MYFYSNERSAGAAINLNNADATKAYLNHYDNYLFLDFVARKGTRQERIEVEAEIIICKRKMTFWERHHNFNSAEAIKGRNARMRQWQEDKRSSKAA